MPENKKIPRRYVRIEYTDGRTEVYNVSRPILEYECNRLGVDAHDVNYPFYTWWHAAGRPGVNGAEPTAEEAERLVRDWLGTVEAWAIEDTEDPPTKRREKSPTSAA
jgi:hypothetical protein